MKKTADDIIRGALDILSSPDRLGSNWLTDADDNLIFTFATQAGPPARCCIDGALKLSARDLTPAKATLDDAVFAPRAAADAYQEVLDRLPGHPIDLNGQGYDAVVAALRAALPPVPPQPEDIEVGEDTTVTLCGHASIGEVGFDVRTPHEATFENITPAEARRLGFRLFVQADRAEGRS